MILLLLSALLASSNAAYVISVHGDVYKDVEFFTRTFPWIIDNIGGELIVEYNLIGSGRYSVPQMCALKDLKLNTFLQAQYLKCEAEGKPSGYCLCEAGIDPQAFKKCVASAGSLASSASVKYKKLGINFTPVIELQKIRIVYGLEDILFLKEVCTIFGNNLPRGCDNYSNQTESFPDKKAYAQFDRNCDKEFPISDDVDKPATTTEWTTIGTTPPWIPGGTTPPWIPGGTTTTTTSTPPAGGWSTISIPTPELPEIPPWVTGRTTTTTTPTPPPPTETTPPPGWFTTTTQTPPGCNTAPDGWFTTPPPTETTPPPGWFTTTTQTPPGCNTAPDGWFTTPPPGWFTTTTQTPPGCNTAPDGWSTTPPPWSTTPPPWSTTPPPWSTTPPPWSTMPPLWSTTPPPWSTTPPPWSTTPPPWSTTPPPWSTTPPPWSTTPTPWSTTPPPWSTTPPPWFTTPALWPTTPPPWSTTRLPWLAKSDPNQNKGNEEHALPKFTAPWPITPPPWPITPPTNTPWTGPSLPYETTPYYPWPWPHLKAKSDPNQNKGNGEHALPKFTAPWPITPPPWPITPPTNTPWTGPSLPYETTPYYPWPWPYLKAKSDPKQNKGNDENTVPEAVPQEAESEIPAE